MSTNKLRAQRKVALLALLALSGCGGGDETVSSASPTYTVGGAASGLTGSGLVLTLNGGSDLAVGVNGSFSFLTAVASGSSYVVTVKTQPVNPSQTCVVTNASGSVGNSMVSNVSVGCTTNSYVVGGIVSGLSGSELVLRLNGTTSLPTAANGLFAFPTPLASGAAYTVTVATQPTSPFQTCVVANGTGVISGSAVSVGVTCTIDAYSVGGTVSGLTGAGLVLQLNGGQQVTVNSNGSFIFPAPLLRGANYSATVKTQTSTYRELCALSNESGTNLSADVASIRVDCAVVLGFVYLTDLSANILEYGIQPLTGALMPVGVVGSAGNQTRNFAVTPDHRTLYASALNAGKVYTFSVDQSKGTLSVLGTPLPTGTANSGADSLAMTPSGKFLYVANAYDGTVALLDIDPTTGAPTLQGVAATPPPVSGPSSLQDLGITPDGAFLYVLNGAGSASASLTAYAINSTTGALTAGSTLAPVDAEGLTIDPQGHFLYLRSSFTAPPFIAASATVSPYAIDPGTGALTAVGVNTTVTSNGKKMVIAPSGNYAYLLGTFNFSPVHNHIDTFAINPSTGVLTVLGSPTLVPGEPQAGIALDATGDFLFTRNFRPAGTFDPSIALPDGSSFRITRSGANAGQLSAAGTGAGTPRGYAGLVVIQ